MWPPIFAPAITRLGGRPRPYGKGPPYADGAVAEVRALIEGTTLTYHQIAKRTGASPASISP
jgi:O6-methylguanine-DNA--protein-cysteine methyltransferase